MEPLLALLVTFGLMWALLIRPQQRRMRQHQAVVSSLRAGDEIVTAGGIYGTVQSVDEESMIVRVAPGVELRILRAAVSQRITEDEDEDMYGVDGEAGVVEPTREEET
jgi:preprotein translocase subunit YajC